MRTLHMLHTLDAEVGEITSTVRNGFKWADLELGEIIDLCVCLPTPADHVLSGRGQIYDLWFGRFKDIPSRLLRNEHEVRSREYNGLLSSMRFAYGDKFTEENPVTVVVYKRIS